MKKLKNRIIQKAYKDSINYIDEWRKIGPHKPPKPIWLTRNLIAWCLLKWERESGVGMTEEELRKMAEEMEKTVYDEIRIDDKGGFDGFIVDLKDYFISKLREAARRERKRY